ncbi:MAG: hypothetical protein F6K22_09670 [Okeania sp. SIO2F4]|uniref:hypothetical protein n=1 Tax=Okeania sp. SIO2F4 TaxID=2607790 RepID=UPI00142BF631|nr:hypothetical protein [Okeania sp. SIO2F4]NES03095.1 hypothetical protein [Okeania sp. SIO2F4]
MAPVIHPSHPRSWDPFMSATAEVRLLQHSDRKVMRSKTTALLVDWICRGDLGIPSYGLLRKRPLFLLERRGFKPYFFGKDYIDEACNSAKSLKKINPSIKISLACNQNPEYKDKYLLRENSSSR